MDYHNDGPKKPEEYRLDPGHVCFVELPGELRNMIYEYALLREDDTINLMSKPGGGAYVPYNRLGLDLNALLSCTPVHAEAVKMLYGNYTFRLNETFMRQIGPSVRHLKRVELCRRKNKHPLVESLHRLRYASGLELLRINEDVRHHFRKPEALAKALGPLVKHLWEAKEEKEGKDALGLLEFAPVRQWSVARLSNAVWQEFGERTKEIIRRDYL